MRTRGHYSKSGSFTAASVSARWYVIAIERPGVVVSARQISLQGGSTVIRSVEIIRRISNSIPEA